jgi:hypothetical protein
MKFNTCIFKGEVWYAWWAMNRLLLTKSKEQIGIAGYITTKEERLQIKYLEPEKLREFLIDKLI